MNEADSLRPEHDLSAEDVRALLRLPPDPARKQAILDALVDSMTEEEANELERHINEMCEATDGIDHGL